MEISESRKFFPYLQTGKVYMNHAAISPLSSRVVDKINEYIYQCSMTEIENYASFQKVVTDTKNKIGSLINADPSRIAYVDNTTDGINILAQGLNFKPGDRIILNDIEFPANIYPFMNLGRDGVEIDFVKSHSGAVTFEDIEAAVTPATKLISISHVQFVSGYRADVARIGELCREKGIIFCVDAIQSAGAIRIDVEKMKIDYLSSGIQKWLMGLQGLAFIFVTEELQERIVPKYVGWTSVEDAWNLLDFNLKLRKGADRFQNGSVSAVGIASLNASLSLMLELGFSKIEETILTNTKYFQNELQNIGVAPLLKDMETKNLSGIVGFSSDNASEIFEELKSKDIIAAVREGIVRFSPHYYNNQEDIDRVIDALKEIIR